MPSRKCVPFVVGLLLASAVHLQAQPNLIGWQGMLTDTAGTPLSGTVNLSFSLYNVAEAGTAIWTKDTLGIPIQNGLASLPLGPFENIDFGEPLWLGVTVNSGTEISPRSPLNSSPSALTLLAPATINGSYADSQKGVLHVSNAATSGVAIGISAETAADSGRAFSGIAMSTSGRNYGVWGESPSPSGRGVLGRAASETGPALGVAGLSKASEGTGIYGHAQSTTGVNFGVRGITSSPDGYSGYFTGGRGTYIDNTLRAGGIHAATQGVMFPDSTIQTSAAGFGLVPIAAGTVVDAQIAGPFGFSVSTGNVTGVFNNIDLQWEITIAGVAFDHENYFTQISLYGTSGNFAPLMPVIGSADGKLIVRILDNTGAYAGFLPFSFVVFAY